MNDAAFLQRLRSLIGRDCRHLGRRCQMVEILAEEGALVLESRDGATPIQTDQYGHAAYRGPEVVLVPIFGEDPGTLSEDLLDLLANLKNSDLAAD